MTRVCWHTFMNLRAYAYWAFQEALDPDKGDDLALLPDRELLADLRGPLDNAALRRPWRRGVPTPR